MTSDQVPLEKTIHEAAGLITISLELRGVERTPRRYPS